MVKKYSLFFFSIFLLSTFSSCGFIKMDLSALADQITDFSPKPGHWGPCPANPPVLYPAPIFPETIYQPPTNSPKEVKPWPENSREPTNNKSPSRAGATLVQTKQARKK